MKKGTKNLKERTTKYDTVSTSDTSGTMRQKQVEPIIISDANDTGYSVTRQQISNRKLLPFNISARTTSATKDKWICNGRFVASTVDSFHRSGIDTVSETMAT